MTALEEPMRKHCSLFPALAVLAACDGLQGREFASEDEVAAAAGAFVVLGRFDAHFPARVVQVEERRDSIEFTHRRSRHGYPGYDGFLLRVVHLQSERGEGVLVLRSRDRIDS